MPSSSLSAVQDKVSFTVRRPSPVSRQSSTGADSDRDSGFKVPALPKHLTDSGRSTPSSPLAKGQTAFRAIPRRTRYAEPDSSDEEEEQIDEIVTGFDQFGVQRLYEKPKKGPLVIPALQNRDWREVARKRKADIYVPGGEMIKTGADGSVGGLGTHDTINSGPQTAGLTLKEKRIKLEEPMEGVVEEVVTEKVAHVEETEDEKARRAILASLDSDGDTHVPKIDVIPIVEDSFSRSMSETDTYREDVLTRPDVATLEDYERVPVAEFGAALLRGMGWKPGQAASRKRTGPIEPYLPAHRPALLGIGAKELVTEDDGSNPKKGSKKPERRYIPVVKLERSPRSRHGSSSRRSSRSPASEKRRERDSDRDREKSDGYRSRDRDGRSDRKDRHSESDRDKEKDRDRKNRDRDSDHNRDRRDRDRRDRDSGRDRDHKRERDRDYGRSRGYDREKDR